MLLHFSFLLFGALCFALGRIKNRKKLADLSSQLLALKTHAEKEISTLASMVRAIKL